MSSNRGARLNAQAEALNKARRKAAEAIQKAEDVLLAQEQRHARRQASRASGLAETYPALAGKETLD